MPRLAALDYGSRRIGVAVADEETGLAFPRPALRRSGGAGDLDALEALLRREAIGVIVVCLPVHMSGEEGRQAELARGFGERLAERGFEVVYWDERLTSWQAGEELAAAGRSPARRSGELDSAAARIILQEYLDAQRRQSSREEEAAE